MVVNRTPSSVRCMSFYDDDPAPLPGRRTPVGAAGRFDEASGCSTRARRQSGACRLLTMAAGYCPYARLARCHLDPLRCMDIGEISPGHEGCS